MTLLFIYDHSHIELPTETPPQRVEVAAAAEAGRTYGGRRLVSHVVGHALRGAIISYAAQTGLTPPKFFSTSHSSRFVAVASGGQPRIGVDIESMEVAFDVGGVERLALSRREAREFLGDARGRERFERFIEVWTQKEATFKALSPLARKGLDLSMLHMEPDLGGSRCSAPDRTIFAHNLPSVAANYAIAVALDSAAQQTIEIVDASHVLSHEDIMSTMARLQRGCVNG